MLKKVLSLPLILAVSGCMSYAPIETPPQTVAFTSKTAQTRVASYSTVAIRASQKTGKDEQEVLGASCAIKGNGYTARVITPAQVELPTYLGKTDPVQVTCKAAERTASETLEPYNATLARLSSTSSSGGLLGAVISGAVSGIAKATRDPSKDEFAYRQMFVLDLSAPQ